MTTGVNLIMFLCLCKLLVDTLGYVHYVFGRDK